MKMIYKVIYIWMTCLTTDTRLQNPSNLRNSQRRLSMLEFKKVKRLNSNAIMPEIQNQVTPRKNNRQL